ncbi:MAG: hypothetical protein EZS28_002707 [Streblomastix strix]|uniref:Uncharacterized protein n=1 Tax=Streblomastix strix TaxID=222440 RepID=A0A5J4X538_9EUKA|nr:MAG: hypothetical protein EZS28_002707 [Streblomastix strix]
MISIAAQAVVKIREDSNALTGFKAVTEGNFLHSDIFSEETIQKADRYMNCSFLQQLTSMLPPNYVYPPRGYYGYQQRPIFPLGRGYDTFDR